MRGDIETRPRNPLALPPIRCGPVPFKAVGKLENTEDLASIPRSLMLSTALRKSFRKK
jgi:hypothetical protein